MMNDSYNIKQKIEEYYELGRSLVTSSQEQLPEDFLMLRLEIRELIKEEIMNKSDKLFDEFIKNNPLYQELKREDEELKEYEKLELLMTS